MIKNKMKQSISVNVGDISFKLIDDNKIEIVSESNINSIFIGKEVLSTMCDCIDSLETAFIRDFGAENLYEEDEN